MLLNASNTVQAPRATTVNPFSTYFIGLCICLRDVPYRRMPGYGLAPTRLDPRSEYRPHFGGRSQIRPNGQDRGVKGLKTKGKGRERGKEQGKPGRTTP